MRFKQLKGLTSLPIERIRRQFRDESVVTVLPVSDDGGRRDSLLVATANALAVITAVRGAAPGDWMTRWVSWDLVRFTDEADADGDPEGDEEYHLTVLIGGLRFHAWVAGETGRRLLRDFVVAATARRALRVSTG